MSEADAVWSSLILAGAVYEAYTLFNGRTSDTLSETTRRWFQVRTTAGKVTFSVLWVSFTVWYLIHIAF